MRLKIIVLFILVIVFVANSFKISAHEVSWPGKRLRKAFLEAEGFKQRQVSLTKSQINFIEKELGEKIGSEDTSPVFYIAYRGKKVIGVIVFVDAFGEYGKIELSVVMGPNGKVKNVDVWEQSDTRKIQEKPFLNQFIGKKAFEPFEIGKDITPVEDAKISSRAVAKAVKKALLLIYQVFLRR